MERSAILILDTDSVSDDSRRCVNMIVRDAKAKLGSGSNALEVVVLRVEGMTKALCDRGLLGAYSMRPGSLAKDFVADARLSESSVLVPMEKDQLFLRQSYPMCSKRRKRRADRVFESGSVRQYIYDGDTVKRNLIMTLEFALHYSDYKVLCICGTYGRMHTLDQLVRNFTQTDTIPVSVSAYQLLPALQHFIPNNSRVLALTWQERSFEDNYDTIIFPSMNVQRSRLKIIGVSDILSRAGLESEHHWQIYSTAAVLEITSACKQLIESCEGSPLQIRAVLCPHHATIYKNALRKVLHDSRIPVYNMVDMIEFLVKGMSCPAYSWKQSAHLQQHRRTDSEPPLKLQRTTRVPVCVPAHPPSKSRATGAMGILQVDGSGYWNKLPIQGDAADCSTYSYNVMYMRPEGFSFRCCQTGPTQNMSQESWSFAEGTVFVPRESSSEAHLYYPAGWGSPGVPRSPDATLEDEKGTTYIYKGTTILRNIVKAVQHLVASNVVGISSDCGFMRSMNDMVRQIPEVADARIPVALSSLALLPVLDTLISNDARILVLTANSESFNDYYDKLVPSRFGVPRSKLKVVGCERIQGFGVEVADALTVDADQAAARIAEQVQSEVGHYEDKDSTHRIRAVLFECAELPGYNEAVKQKLTPQIPVYDAISLIDFLHSGAVMDQLEKSQRFPEVEDEGSMAC